MKSLHIKSRIWISSEKGTFLGEGRIELLRKIRETGSISKAAKDMKMSYKKAWELVNSMNQQFSEPLVLVSTGGLNGGGSIITSLGEKAIEAYSSLNERNRLFLNEELEKMDLFK